MNIEEQIKEILGYDEYEAGSLWVYLVETDRTGIIKELSSLITKEKKKAVKEWLTNMATELNEANKETNKRKNKFYIGGQMKEGLLYLIAGIIIVAVLSYFMGV